jgi:hypothetical protein
MTAPARAIELETPQAVPPTRDELLTICRTVATSPNILDLFIGELNRAGFAGEERASRLIFLALVSRLFKEPVSLAVKGPSSVGKSHTTQQVLSFFPSESYYALSAMSEKALAYSQEPLKHRFLVIYEAEGISGRTASYFIRSLLSEGCIKYKTVTQTENGWEPKELCVEGPTGLLTTTTLVTLHPENETRLLSVPVNDTQEQTRRILEAIASERPTVHIDYTPWHAFQQWLGLGSTKVTIPFSQRLAETTYAGTVRVRRDFGKLLSLIRTHALIHQASRQSVDGAFVATLEDYAAVRELIADLLAEAAEASISAAVRATVQAVARLVPNHLGGVPQSALVEVLGLDKSVVSRRVKEAIEGGYIYNNEPRQGVPARLMIGDPLPEEQQVLPEPERLAA